MGERLMEGVRKDVADLIGLLDRAVEHSGLKETSFTSRYLHYVGFRERLLEGRMTPKTMRNAEKILSDYLSAAEQASA